MVAKLEDSDAIYACFVFSLPMERKEVGIFSPGNEHSSLSFKLV